MSWFEVLKRRSISRGNARLVRAAARPIVNEFVEKEIIPRMKIIVRKKILNFFEKLPPINISTKKVIQTFTNTDIIMNQVQAKPTCFK